MFDRHTSTAAQYLAWKQAVATSLSSREIAEHVPRALRDNAVFSARTIYAEHVSELKREIATLLQGGSNPAEIRTAMKLRLAKLGYQPDPAKRGGLQDLSSDVRTNLIISMTEQEARGYAVWRSQQDAGVMAVWPANQLYRAEERKIPRDWRQRWESARADLGDATSATTAMSKGGPFIALKNDPSWTHPDVNRFGRPWPPFDFNSGMRLRNVKASDARKMGVLTDTQKPRIVRDPMDGHISSSSAAGMDADVVEAWAAAFGPRARVYQGRRGFTRVAVAPSQGVLAQIIDNAQDGFEATAIFGFPSMDTLERLSALLGRPIPPEAALQITASEVRHIMHSHGAEIRAAHRPITTDDIKRIPSILQSPGRWRLATPQEKGHYKGEAATFIADSGERVCVRLAGSRKKYPHMTIITMWAIKKTAPLANVRNAALVPPKPQLLRSGNKVNYDHCKSQC